MAEGRQDQPATARPTAQPAESDPARDATPSHPDTYLYPTSGIEERHGAIPLWLKLVAIGLIVWSMWYTIRYWNAP